LTAEFTDDTSFELLEAWDRDADAANGATIVFDFSDDATLVYALVRAGAHGFISQSDTGDADRRRHQRGGGRQ